MGGFGIQNNRILHTERLHAAPRRNTASCVPNGGHYAGNPSPGKMLDMMDNTHAWLANLSAESNHLSHTLH
eukprot:9692709-Lingulodinium_polyedra.AAC.1